MIRVVDNFYVNKITKYGDIFFSITTKDHGIPTQCMTTETTGYAKTGKYSVKTIMGKNCNDNKDFIGKSCKVHYTIKKKYNPILRHSREYIYIYKITT